MMPMGSFFPLAGDDATAPAALSPTPSTAVHKNASSTTKPSPAILSRDTKAVRDHAAVRAMIVRGGNREMAAAGGPDAEAVQ